MYMPRKFEPVPSTFVLREILEKATQTKIVKKNAQTRRREWENTFFFGTNLADSQAGGLKMTNVSS